MVNIASKSLLVFAGTLTLIVGCGDGPSRVKIETSIRNNQTQDQKAKTAQKESLELIDDLFGEAMDYQAPLQITHDALAEKINLIPGANSEKALLITDQQLNGTYQLVAVVGHFSQKNDKGEDLHSLSMNKIGKDSENTKGKYGLKYETNDPIRDHMFFYSNSNGPIFSGVEIDARIPTVVHVNSEKGQLMDQDLLISLKSDPDDSGVFAHILSKKEQEETSLPTIIDVSRIILGHKVVSGETIEFTPDSNTSLNEQNEYVYANDTIVRIHKSTGRILTIKVTQSIVDDNGIDVGQKTLYLVYHHDFVAEQKANQNARTEKLKAQQKSKKNK